MDREAMQMALEALVEINKLSIGENAICLPAEIDGAMDALRQALETEQEPVAWLNPEENISDEAFTWSQSKHHTVPLYTAPPKQWVGLTAYEIQEIYSGNQHWGNFACAIEAKLKEKNKW